MAPGPKAGPTRGPSHPRPAPLAMLKTCRAAAMNGPALTASWVASADKARSNTARPGGCSGIGSGISRARSASVRPAGSMRSTKNRVAGLRGPVPGWRR